MIKELGGDERNSQGYQEFEWQLLEAQDFRTLKEAVMSYGLHSPYVITGPHKKSYNSNQMERFDASHLKAWPSIAMAEVER